MRFLCLPRWAAIWSGHFAGIPETTPRTGSSTFSVKNVQRAKAVALWAAWESTGWNVCARRGNAPAPSWRASVGVCEQCHEPTPIPAGNTGSLQTHQHNVTDLNRSVKHFLLKKSSYEVESMKVSNILTAKSSRELMFLGRLFVYQWVVQTKENQNGQV